MELGNIVSFRKDLLFNGAVQVSWLEEDPRLASKAAEYFAFHGPSYHGVSRADFTNSSHKLVDTASFVNDVLSRLAGRTQDDPFMLAIAGYGTGKSHLAVTLSNFLGYPSSATSERILKNLKRADSQITADISVLLKNVAKPFLVVTINGMKDFDLSAEITRQILKKLSDDGLDTTVLENLRPRFRTAIHFTESFFEPLRQDFVDLFGPISLDDIIARLKSQDEEAFATVSEIYSSKMGSPIHAVGQESLHDFIRVTKENYCGEGNHYAGLLILFDEFGRYLEFSVQKPHIAGSGALQQLFECVQANEDAVMLVCFIQYELRAYVSRIAPELRDDLNRYVTRYDSARKVRLSTNIETLIANLLDKQDLGFIQKELGASREVYATVHRQMKHWFPELKDHALWNDQDLFEQVVCEGCWPLHPVSVWTLYKLSTVGKLLQQRSALSLLAEVYDELKTADFGGGRTITPVDLCSDSLVNEFLSSERFGQQGASAHAYETVLDKYRHELGCEDVRVLKSVLLSSKLGTKAKSKEDALALLSAFCGLAPEETKHILHVLEKELAVLEWNEHILRYEITGDSVPRRAFLAYLQAKIEDINSNQRAEIFAQNFKQWIDLDTYQTDFGAQNNITTQDWHYAVSFSNIEMLRGKIDFAVRTWRVSYQPDDPKGQLVYCYAGPNSNLESVKRQARNLLKSCLEEHHISLDSGAPVAIIFLHDIDGSLGEKLAGYWILSNNMDEEEVARYQHFIADRKQALEFEMKDLFSALEKDRHIIFATNQDIPASRTKVMLSRAFSVIYPKIIPFDFDGFSTVRGNAAKDAQVFTRQLITGRFDREWISTATPAQQNRAHKVLVDLWGILDSDGTLRLKPMNKVLREIVELLTDKLSAACKGETEPLNLGTVMEILCSPPYGCNVASAGLIIALFIGSRRNEVNLLKDGVSIGIENWLSTAMPKNFFDLSVLASTELVQVSQDSLSEWESLLEDWELEEAILGSLEYQKKAHELQERVPLPPQLFWKHKNLSEKADNLRRELDHFNKQLTDEIEKIEVGKERMDLNRVSWGGSVLVDMRDAMVGSDKWELSHIKEVEKHIASSRLFLKTHFAEWLRQQKAYNVRNLDTFRVRMSRIGNNLEKLDLIEEKAAVTEHTEMIEAKIKEIEDATRLASDIESFIARNATSSNIKVTTLKSLLERIQQEFLGRIDVAEKLPNLDVKELTIAKRRLAEFQRQVIAKLDNYRGRMMELYNIEQLSSADDIAFWRGEVANLISIYEGEDHDLADLSQVQRQLDLMERHFRMLNDMNRTDLELAELLTQCFVETNMAFADDAPPLDAESVYEGIYERVLMERKALAETWMEMNVPALDEICKYTAVEAQQTKSRLESRPAYLAESQVDLVKMASESCRARLDELEVEGLLVRYQVMSNDNKRRFLEAIFHDVLEVGVELRRGQ